MRRAFLFVLSFALILAGGYLLWLEIFVATRWFSKMILAGTFMVATGVYLIKDEILQEKSPPTPN